jgi:transcription factor C subunit 6
VVAKQMRTGIISTDQLMDVTPSGAWPGHVAIHCVAWHPSLRRAPLLASGTASGLARVDWVEGFWTTPARGRKSKASAKGDEEEEGESDDDEDELEV